ncbi:endo-alpha-N-acetylgalactosaminidase family protein [Paenibacillus sp. WC2504]|uniref:endo-alpha-N-acetylgalactosaminidase family protein n=1 Tax=Paenibacillus sp. WC2504 TaxID=3461403 RepID=UPI004046546A
MKSSSRKLKKSVTVSLALLTALQMYAVVPGGTVLAADGDAYFQDYNNGQVGGWKKASGNATFSVVNNMLKVVTSGVTLMVDDNSPSYQNAELETKLKVESGQGRYGFLFRYVDVNNFAGVVFDNGSWLYYYLKNGTEYYGTIASKAMSTNQTYDIKLRYVDSDIILWIDGEKIASATVGDMPSAPGKIGMRTWFDSKTMYLDDTKVTPYTKPTPPKPDPNAVNFVSESGTLKAELDSTFPRVDNYVWKATGAVMNGQKNYLYAVKINGEEYWPKTTAEKVGNSVIYTMNVEELAVQMKVKMEVVDNTLDMKFTDIQETGSTKVKTIEFPNHSLVSVSSTQPKAQETAAWFTGEWNKVFEEYNDLKNGAQNLNPSGRTFGFVNSDKLAATIVNNVINGNDKVRSSVSDGAPGEKVAALANGAWTYRESMVAPAPEELPWSKVIITPDANNDGVLDWQDGAIVYRSHSDMPYGSDMIKNNISWISMNIATTGMPFLRSLDHAKKIAHLTDEFGQIVLQKGYQAEGHDDSHPDYGGHIGIRQGGKDDFNYFLTEGKKYNIKGGVHINATEYHLDAFQTKMANMIAPLSKGWGWLDQAYYVDQRKDIESGELKRRLDMLKADTGDNLDFVYVDVYTGAGWNAKKLADYINGNGWMLGTEFAGPLQEQASWVHWGTDPGYPNQGDDSKIVRFIRNTNVDGFMSDALLKGNKQSGIGYWQPNSQFYSYQEVTKTFFNQNLPTKYMQHFPIMKMTNDRVDFAGNVSVTRAGDGKIHLTKDGNDIAIMTDSTDISNSTIFIPWDPVKEDKIYHWNPAGGSTTWKVPASWSGVQTAKLYKLTDTDRQFVGDVNVSNGQVTLSAESNVGYVLYKTAAPQEAETIWGDGSPVKDPGFDSHKWETWSKSSSAGTTDHISFKKNSNADDYLEVKGPEDAKVEQVITGLEPGKTYSASVWVNVYGADRKSSISVKQGDNEVSNYLEDTKLKYFAPQHKYYNTNFQRVKVNFDAVSDKATLALNVAPGAGTVSFDDVRIWENPGKTDQAGAVLNEDFENVDEAWGPFVYGKAGNVQMHMVEKGENQVKSYVLDGSFSLKTNEGGAGEWLRTLPQTLRLDTNEKYHLTMQAKADVANQFTVAVRVNDNGTARDLATKTLPAGASTVDLTFTTDNAKNAYLAILKGADNSSAELGGQLVVDNIRVTDETVHAVTGVVLDKTDVFIAEGGTVELKAMVQPENATNKNVTWSSSDESIAKVEIVGGKTIVTGLKTGTAGITATTADGNFHATAQVTVTKVVSVPATTLIAPSSVQTGQTFTVGLSLSNVTEAVYAQDLTISYDTSLMELVSAKPAQLGISLVSKSETTPGKVRFIVASEGAGHAISGSGDVLELTFKAKDITQPATARLAVESAVLGDATGHETSATLGSANVSITIPAPGTPGDINGDNKVSIGDLAMIAANYGKDWNSPDWLLVKKADVTGDNKIDLDDLVKVASQIIQ